MNYIVKNNAELTALLSSATSPFLTSGDVVSLQHNPEEKYTITITEFTKTSVFSDVEFNSFGDVSAVVSNIQVSTSKNQNLTFNNLIVDSFNSSKASWMADVYVSGGTRGFILKNSKLISTAKTYLDVNYSKEEVAQNAILLRNCYECIISNNEISHYNHGISILDVDTFTINKNNIHHMQGDGIRGGGWINCDISENHIHDFFGSSGSVNHMDMIQLWAVSATNYISSDVYIRRNILNAAVGCGTQSIFMRNEKVDQGLVDSSWYWKNIEISDNIIHNSHAHGITVAETIGLMIKNNTLIYDGLINPPMSLSRPSININKNCIDVTVTNNICNSINGPDDMISDNNLELNYDDSFDTNHPSKIFINGMMNGDGNLSNLRLVPTMSGKNLGAVDSQFDMHTSTAQFVVFKTEGSYYKYSFDSTLSVLNGDFLYNQYIRYTPIWSIEGLLYEAHGPILEFEFQNSGVYEIILKIVDVDGEIVSENFSYLKVESSMLLDLYVDTEGVVDHSDYNSTIVQPNPIIDGNTSSFFIGDTSILSVSKANKQLYNLPKFTYGMDIKRVEDLKTVGAGGLFFIHTAFNTYITETGDIKVDFINRDNVKFTAVSNTQPLNDSEQHNLIISYDGLDNKVLNVYIDDTLVASTFAEGYTQPYENWSLSFGYPWNGGGVHCWISNVYMSGDCFEKFELEEPNEASANVNSTNETGGSTEIPVSGNTSIDPVSNEEIVGETTSPEVEISSDIDNLINILRILDENGLKDKYEININIKL